MSSTWFTSTFLNFFKFPQIKDGRSNFFRRTNSAERLNYLVPLLYFNCRNSKDSNSSSFITLQWVAIDSPVHLSIFWNFLILKREHLISCVEPILENCWIIWSLFLYFNSRNLRESNSCSFIGLQWVPIHSPVLLSIFWNFLKLKWWELISWWEPILQNGWIIWSLFVYLSFRNLKDSNSSPFIRFQWVLHDSPLFL